MPARTEVQAAEIDAALALAFVAVSPSDWAMASFAFMSSKPALTASRMTWKADLPPVRAPTTASIWATWSSAYASKAPMTRFMPS